MPYVDQEARNELNSSKRSAKTVGELNYQITVLIDEYVASHGLSYQHINDVMGVLDSAGKEFYRRVAVPYEDRKCAQNGDVYTTWRTPDAQS